MKTRIGLVVLSLFLSLLIGISLGNRHSGASTGMDAKDTGVVIGLSMDTLQEARWQADRDIFVARAEELGASVLVQSANSDDTRQMQDIQSLISNRVDVLVIVPHNGKAMARAVKLAHEAGIPVIAYDRLINDSELDLYISFNNIRVGELQAQFLVQHLPKNRPARIVRLYGAKTDHNSFLFKQGQDNVLQPLIDAGDIIVLHEDWAENWKPENAKKITNAAITRHGTDFDAILSSNDGMAGGAIQALREEGIAGKILVTGQDAELVACQRIVAGQQAMSIYKPIRNLATQAAEYAVKLARGKPVIVRDSMFNGLIDVPSVLLDVITVTRDNIRETVIADGFHSYEDVYRSIPASQRPPRLHSQEHP